LQCPLQDNLEVLSQQIKTLPGGLNFRDVKRFYPGEVDHRYCRYFLCEFPQNAKKKKTRDAHCAYKLNLSKAYDRVD
jgi:hypothetical protein